MSRRLKSLKILEQGREILDPILLSHGFEFHMGSAGKSHGGDFAQGEYVRADRKLDIHFRWSLGLVTYHVGTLNLSHTDYMRALHRGVARNRYPGFSDDPLQAFRDLAYDLGQYCRDFLSGDGTEFERCVEATRAWEKLSGLERTEPSPLRKKGNLG